MRQRRCVVPSASVLAVSALLTCAGATHSLNFKRSRRVYDVGSDVARTEANLASQDEIARLRLDRAAEGASGGQGKDRLLVFYAVSARDSTMNLVTRNLAHLKQNYTLGPVDVFLAHYDMAADAWRKYLGSRYADLVQFAVNRQGFKFALAKELLPEHLASRQYEWIWLLDEDVGFGSLDVNKFVTTARRTHSVIVQPSLAWTTLPKLRVSALAIQTFACQPNDEQCSLLQRHAECHYRHTNYVEVMAPLISQAALLKVLVDCTGCVHEHSTWGLDMVWCSWTSRMLGQPGACAVIDDVSIVHLNHKTLGKWTKDGAINRTEVSSNYWSARFDVRRRFPEDFADELKVLSCARQ